MRKMSAGAFAAALILLPHIAVQAQAAVSSAPTFEQVLAAPDDPALNTAYAKEQAAAGNFIFAAAAYERLLLGQPDDDVTRIAYVDVLLHLDDAVTAGQELAKLQSISLTPEQQITVAALQTRVAAATSGARK